MITTQPSSGPNGIIPSSTTTTGCINPALLAASNPLYAAWMASFGQQINGIGSPNGQTTNNKPSSTTMVPNNGDSNFQITQQKLAQFLPQQQIQQMLAMAAMANSGKLTQIVDPSTLLKYQPQHNQQTNPVKQSTKPLWNPSNIKTTTTTTNEESSINKGMLLFFDIFFVFQFDKQFSFKKYKLTLKKINKIFLII